MKIAPETALAGWAVGTVWLLVYVVTHYANRRLGLDLTSARLIQGASVVLGAVLFPMLRRWFRAWLDKYRRGGG